MNIENFLQTTSRAVRNAKRDGMPVKILEVSRSFPGSKESLWEMLTVPEKLSRCFLPVTGDLREGGHFQFEGNAGGTILACEPHDRIETTWEMHGQESWVELTLKDVAGGVSLTLLHTAAVPDDLWRQFGPGAVGIGWEMGFAGLQKHIESGGTFTSAEGMGWAASDEGVAVMRGSSDGWADASIAAGTPVEEAKAAAATVIALYTGAE